MSVATSVAALRATYPGALDQAFLDTGTYGLPSLAVRAAMDRALDAWQSGRGSWREWEADGERARAAFARLVGTGAENVAQLGSASSAAGLVASGLARPGANFVVGAGEFRSNLYPWLAQERRGVELRLVRGRSGPASIDDFAAAIDGRTAVVAVSSVQSSNGQRLPLASLGELCRAAGARLFVDGTQSVGALRLDLEPVDFLAVAAYKWLLAPRGTACLYVRPERRDELDPIFAGWKSPDDPHAGYYGPPLDLAPRASRFDLSLAWMIWVGAAVALEQAAELGVAALERHGLALADRYRAGLAELGLETGVPEAERSHIVGLRVEGAEHLREALEAGRVVAAVRDGFVRVGFALYNDAGDVERALAVIRSSTGG